jgi:hypothetical protein
MNKIFKHPIFYTILIVGAFVFLQASGILSAAGEPASIGELNTPVEEPIEIDGGFGIQAKKGTLKITEGTITAKDEICLIDKSEFKKGMVPCSSPQLGSERKIIISDKNTLSFINKGYPLLVGGMVFPTVSSYPVGAAMGTVVYKADGCLYVYTGSEWKQMCPKE